MTRGRLARWIPIAPLLAGLVILGCCLQRGLASGRAAADGLWVDPAALEPGLRGRLPAWADPRWEAELAHLLATWPPFQVGSGQVGSGGRAGDAAALSAFAAALGALSFIESLEPLDASEIGRRGELALAFRLREPMACVRTGAGFLTVAQDGTVLSGLWSAPPEIGGCWLPLLASDAADDETFTLARPGDWLSEREHLDALDVAVSMRAHLDRGEREILGRVVIDASRGQLASPREPGVRILLEDERLVLFGRPPSTDEPGELPLALKWDSLGRALQLLRGGPAERSWDLVDVRWDQAETRRRSLADPFTRPYRPYGPAGDRRAATRRSERRPVPARPADPRDGDDRPRVR